MHLLLSLFLIPFIIAYESHTQIPDHFLGKWKVDLSRDDTNGFYNYMDTRGIEFFKKNKAMGTVVTRELTKLSKYNYTYTVAPDSMLAEKVKWENWRLGEEFGGRYVDSTDHKITFAYDPTHDVLIERHVNEKGEVDIYKYIINDKNEMVQKLHWKNGDGKEANAQRFYVKQ